jgi:peptidoglycan hydrolase CwlO-like protein
MKILLDDNGNEINTQIVNRKLESFVEVVLQKLLDVETDLKESKKREKRLEKKIDELEKRI